ncbi:tail fiber domain-containing protein [Pseudonocardia sp. TRM90224]|uniref:tail fiber domain-containing protein n=1 Tax=Pseudonocardia sp. TRM90224 TaxID=2812678 RepID=UPI001E487FA3|nr:tail fiber domain-containing protein [Pseudonocardia sp. TRM90224]
MPAEEEPVGPSPDGRSVIERIRLLHGVTWEWKDRRYRRDTRPRSIGLIAQDVQAAFPEAVVTDRRGNLAVDYNGLVGALVEGIKELADRVEELERRNGD